jgi:hypothetical protein
MMTRSTFTIAVAFVCSTAAAAPLVTFESPCSCQDNHGKGRWAEKNDASVPPADAGAIQSVTPSDIFNWQGPTEPLTRSCLERDFPDLPMDVIRLPPTGFVEIVSDRSDAGHRLFFDREHASWKMRGTFQTAIES